MKNLQTQEDVQLVKQYLVLPIAIEVVERNLKLIQAHNFKFPEVFAAHMTNIRNQISRELYDNKQLMRQLGIKVFEECRTEEGISGKYLCRGYQHEMNLLWMTIKSECEIKIADLLRVDLSKVEYEE